MKPGNYRLNNGTKVQSWLLRDFFTSLSYCHV